MKQKKIHIFALSIEPHGISGSETILVQTYKRLDTRVCEIIVHTWEPGKSTYQLLGLNRVSYSIAKVPIVRNFYVSFGLRIIYGLYLGLTMNIEKDDILSTVIYPGSDFWPDFLPAVFLKLRYPKIKLIGTFYLTAPNPFFGYKEGAKKLRLPSMHGLFYWLMQLPVVPIYNRIANIIFVTSQPDAEKFPHKRFYIVKGGVDLNDIERYKREQQMHSGIGRKLFDCVFMGRFHPQKGVIELIHMWKRLMEFLPNAQLVMIGEGPLFAQVKRLVEQLDLINNIKLTGSVLDNDEKYTLFAASRIVVHPALYDSGGMAAAEAMAFGLPGVSFDLEALKTYYPKGMLKIAPFDYQAFIEMMKKLLTEPSFYEIHSKEALDLVYEEWNWDNKGQEIQNLIVTL